MKDFNLLLWVKEHPMKTIYLFVGAITFGAFLGYAFPGLAQWAAQIDLVGALGKIGGFLFGILIVLGVFLQGFGG